MTRVLIGIISNEAARYAEFWACMMRLEVPAGSVKDVAIGTDYVSNQNILAQRCLDDGFDYLWLMGDDHSFGPDLLEKLLVSAQAFDLPILVPLCSARRAPFALVDYGRNPDPIGPDYLSVSLAEVPAEGIIELDAAGSAGMLIRHDVLDVVRQPWFENSPRSEDILFCEKAVDAGFKIHADLSCRLGHILTAVVTPGHDGNDWVTGLVMGDLQLAIGTAEQLTADAQEVPLGLVDDDGPAFVPFDPHNRGDNPHPDAEPVDWRAAMEEGKARARPLEEAGGGGVGSVEPPLQVPADQPPVGGSVGVEPTPEAERIEIWVDEEFVWWWRAIGHDGAVLMKGSAVNEPSVLAAAELHYPGVMVYQIAREVEDSRNIRPYRVPGRMFNQ